MTRTDANRMAQLRLELALLVDEADAVDSGLPTVGMLRSLLGRALAALEVHRGTNPSLSAERAIRIGEHALDEWRRFVAQPMRRSSTIH